jgi:hypothetical protein
MIYSHLKPATSKHSFVIFGNQLVLFVTQFHLLVKTNDKFSLNGICYDGVRYYLIFVMIRF